MAKFTYTARDISGTDHNGDIDASDIHTAAVILRKKGLVVISVNPRKENNKNFLDKFMNRVSFGDVVTSTRQLATMIGAGLVLSEALDILAEQQTNKRLKQVFEETSHDVKSGLTLAQSLAKHPDVFPPIFTNLVKSGEASGKLDDVLLKMADSLEKEREFRARVKGAMIYPIVVITLMFVVILIMMTFVVPKMTALYKDSSIELPLPTKILIAFSDILLGYWWLLIILAVGGFIAFKRWIKTAQGAMIFDSVVLKIPLIGRIVTCVTLTNMTRTFGLLVAAGIPLLEAINIVSEVLDNTSFKNALKESYSGVSRGMPFSSMLVSNIFPKIVSHMVKIGEETGKVDEMFFKLANYFESEADNLVKNLTVAIEPIVLVVLGIGVGFLVVSIILPIYKLTTSFGG